MAFIGTFSRSLLESATAIYFGGVPVNLMDAQGNVLLGEGLPDAPTITSTIADRTYAAGDAAVTVDLRTKFDGATSYTVSPTNPAVSITDYTLTINPTAAMTQTTFTVRGINGGGASDPLTFKLTVNAPSPVLLKPFPDQSLLIGGGTVILPLAEYFSGASAYAVSPSGEGVTISGGNVVISRTIARDVIVTVTATNTTGQDTSDSFALLIAAPANQAPVITGPIAEQAPVANVTFTANLASHFEDPEGATLTFDYSGTLPTGITRTGAVFSGTATVAGQTASGVLRARDPGNLEAEAPVAWLVAVQPAITADPFTLTAGQTATIRFNTTVDTVTVAQGNAVLAATRVGSTNDWTFTPVTTEPVSISATKAGWTAYSATITPAGALADIVKTAANTLQLVNVDENTPPFDLTMTGRYAGTRTVTPADMADGPVAHVGPSQTGTAAVGEVLTLDPGLWLNFDSAGRAILEHELRSGADIVQGVNGLTYTVQASDQGKSLVWHVTGSDQNGDRTVQTNAIAVPASVENWWDDRALIDVDLANNRARINGVTYASIAAAKTANAIKTSGSGVDYIDVSGLGTSIALAATGVTPPTTGSFAMMALDDGDDGVPADEYIQIGVLSSPRASFSSISGGTNLFLPNTTVTTPVNTPLRLAMRAKAGPTLDSYRGSVNGTKVTSGQDAAVTLPAVTRLCIGNRSANDRAWVPAGGTLSRLILINADLSNSAIDALLA